MFWLTISPASLVAVLLCSLLHGSSCFQLVSWNWNWTSLSMAWTIFPLSLFLLRVDHLWVFRLHFLLRKGSDCLQKKKFYEFSRIGKIAEENAKKKATKKREPRVTPFVISNAPDCALSTGTYCTYCWLSVKWFGRTSSRQHQHHYGNFPPAFELKNFVNDIRFFWKIQLK